MDFWVCQALIFKSCVVVGMPGAEGVVPGGTEVCVGRDAETHLYVLILVDLSVHRAEELRVVRGALLNDVLAVNKYRTSGDKLRSAELNLKVVMGSDHVVVFDDRDFVLDHST